MKECRHYQCKNKFEPSNNRQKFCSPECREKVRVRNTPVLENIVVGYLPTYW